MARHARFYLPKKIWDNYLKIEHTARGHTVQKFDYQHQIYNIIIALRPDGKGKNVQIVNLQARTCTCENRRHFNFHVRTSWLHILIAESIQLHLLVKCAQTKHI
ncbi:hypothetical protein ACH5RR_030356 [Cinchona calisaya]|uniref:Uncharacterized protein n=1 Tax=Cinchona calisaya TaxID=153742 RepID=A0ABD2YY26_9GENT